MVAGRSACLAVALVAAAATGLPQAAAVQSVDASPPPARAASAGPTPDTLARSATSGPSLAAAASARRGVVPDSYIVTLRSGDPDSVAGEHARARQAGVTRLPQGRARVLGPHDARGRRPDRCRQPCRVRWCRTTTCRSRPRTSRRASTASRPTPAPPGRAAVAGRWTSMWRSSTPASTASTGTSTSSAGSTASPADCRRTTCTVMEPTSRASSQPRTTASAWWAWHQGRACGPSGCSTAREVGPGRRSCAGWTG